MCVRLFWFWVIMSNIPQTPFPMNKCWGRNYSYNRHTTHRNIQQLYFWNLGHLNHIHFGKCTFCKLCCIRYTYIRDRLKLLIGIKLVVNQLWLETIACFGIMIILLLVFSFKLQLIYFLINLLCEYKFILQE